MSEVILIVLFILSVLVFALIGLIGSLIWLGRKLGNDETRPANRSPSESASTATKPTLKSDVLAAQRLLKHLRSTHQLSADASERIDNYLQSNFPAELEVRSTSSAHRVQAESQPVHPIAASEIVEAEIATEAPSEKTVLSASNQSTFPRAPTSIAPWDRPDPPPRVPRRSMAEILAGFMQEKNMRWGELTSGILIVLSAVGLVVSLRDELSDAIPYFSSILFMLITGAIIGAGIYTLKKWKLRHTSRGTLVIGLLLIPLNFVAACVLSGGEGRRELSDPWLWMAVIVGLGGFSAMTWYASCCLLRKQVWPLVVAIVGCGAGTILLNRLTSETQSSPHVWLLTVPLVASFLIGAGSFESRVARKKFFSQRTMNRMYLRLGISAFAILAALSLLLIRAEFKMASAVAITPVLIIVSLIVSHVGLILSPRRIATANVQPELEARLSNDALKETAAENGRLLGTSLQVLGMVLSGIFLLGSLANPTAFAVNCLVGAAGVMLIAVHQAEFRWLPIVWSLLAAGGLFGLNLWLGEFEFDRWTSPERLQTAVVSGKSGICLLVCGAIAAGLQNWFANRIGGASVTTKKSLARAGFIIGGCIFLCGCIIALLASVLDRGDVFDNMAASALLLVAGVGAMVIVVCLNRRTGAELTLNQSGGGRSAMIVAHFAAALVLLGLLHAMIWNLSISDWLTSLLHHAHANWVWVFVLQGSMLAIAVVVMRFAKDQAILQYWSMAGIAAAALAAIAMMPEQTGNGSAAMVVVTGAAGLLSWKVRSRSLPVIATSTTILPLTSTMAAGILFQLTTLILTVVTIGELVSKFDWCPVEINPRYGLIQIIGVSIWSAGWTASYIFFSKNKIALRLNEFIGIGLVTIVSALVTIALLHGSTAELFRNTEPFLFSLNQDRQWVFAALAAVGIAVLGLLIQRPTAIKGAALILVWMLAWASAALFFEPSQSAASAIRWLLPAGGLIAAVLIGIRRPMIPVWAKARSQLRLSGRSTWKPPQTQQLINFALLIAVLAVLAISTITVSQVMLNGAESLGGPAASSWFARMDKVISFGGPLTLVVTTFLLYAISERREWLATAGSAVFQYMVVLAVVLLFLSPHPQLASAWFVRVLQSMSLGMTLYGFAWWMTKSKISSHTLSLSGDAPRLSFGNEPRRWRWPSQIEIHTLINGFLVTSLAVLVFARFYFVPDQPGDWINSVGSLLGVTAWLLFAGLALVVGRESLRTAAMATGDQESNGWTLNDQSLLSGVTLIDWMGLVLIAFVGAVVDYQLGKRGAAAPWVVFQVLAAGSVIVGALQCGLVAWITPRLSGREKTGRVGPSLIAQSVGLLFAVRGAWSHVASFWFYESLIIVVVVSLFVTALALRRSGLSFVSAAVSMIATAALVTQDPGLWFVSDQPDWINLSTIVVTSLALIQLVVYLYWRRQKTGIVSRSFVALPNVTLLIGSIWVLLGSWYQMLCDSGTFLGDSSLVNPLGITAVGLLIGLVVVSLANDRRKFWTAASCMISLGVMIAVVSYFAVDDASRGVGVLSGCAAVVMGWGVGWQQRTRLTRLANNLGAVRLASLKQSLNRQLPIYSLLVGAMLVLGSCVAILTTVDRPLRYCGAVVPLLLAIGLGCLSNAGQRRWLQLTSLALVTLGAMLVGWADLSPESLRFGSAIGTMAGKTTSLDWWVRGLLVLAGAMFVYGGLVTRWVRKGDFWLKSLREMAAVTCGLAICFLSLVVFGEAVRFEENFGCGLPLTTAGSAAVVVIGMIVGLISIAVRPERDPFSLSQSGRQSYVYIAQFVTAGLIAHIYFTMPWLFRIGIKEYWPYVAMAICFSGVGLAQLLERRNLTVLGQPLFATAAVVPVLVAIAIFAIEIPKVDSALAMLTVGLAYLMISYLHQSLLSGAAAILFGNLALWMFYGRFPAFSFFDHPQLWLIPPAISVLIAGQFHRDGLTKSQLALLRYVCVAIIYVSSTSEIFISGLKDNLWPPMVLALLSVGGIMTGIGLQVRAFLYLGCLFLLTAMITMVSHAQQQLDHFWPWWAFGITLGIAILVMFGLFEKKKNEMKAIAGRLREWES